MEHETYADTVIIVRDRRDQPWYWKHNLIQDHYRPLIGGIGHDLYDLYCRHASNEDQSCNPSFSLIAAHLNISRNSITYYNLWLEWVGLVVRDRPEVAEVVAGRRRMRRLAGRSNTYYLLPVEPLTEQRIEEIRQKVEGCKIPTFITLYKSIFTDLLDAWHPIDYWYRRLPQRRATRTIANQPGLFELDGDGQVSIAGPEAERINREVLERMGLDPAAAADLAGRHDPVMVLASSWYAAVQDTLTNPPGFIRRQLQKQLPPPAHFIDLADWYLYTDEAELMDLRQAAASGYGVHEWDFVDEEATRQLINTLRAREAWLIEPPQMTPPLRAEEPIS